MNVIRVRERAEYAAEKMKKVGLFATEHVFCDLYCLEPGQTQKVHAHAGATKLYFALAGEVWATIGDETRALKEGDLAFAEPGQLHGIENRSTQRAEVLVVMGPNPNR